MRKVVLLLLVLLLIFAVGVYSYLKPYYDFLTKTLDISVVKTLFTTGGLNTYNDQVNILILGIAGADNDGPNLSDSIIVANYNFKTNKMTTISVPRDIWSPTLQDKVNSAYAYGEAKKPGGGFTLAKAEIETVVGMPIQYAAVIDFNKFEKLIDFFGGIDVNVDNSFTDHLYPIAGRENDLCNGDPEYKCRYETVSFTKGMTHMDGAVALEFVRSRHAEGIEGSDFARENRQQKVIFAVKNKILTITKKNDLKQLTTLYDLINDIVGRDINNQQVAIIAKNIFLKAKFQQNTVLLSEDFFDVPEYSPTYNGMWVLIPHGGNFNSIHAYITCNLNGQSNCEQLKPHPTPTP